jgi:hypothetical protein
MPSPGRLWWLLRRDLRRGWKGARHAYRTLPRLPREWKWHLREEKPQPVPIHLLTGKDDWQLAAWMLASFFTFSELTWPLVLHDDGTLPPEAMKAFSAMFPHTRFISRSEADDTMEKALKPFPFCYEYRGLHPLALKAFDIPHFAGQGRYLLFDSDVLFFNYPAEIVRWAHGPADDTSCWFNADVADSALVSAQEAKDELGVELWPKVNSGLCLLHRSATDFDFCDKALAQTTILRGHVWRIEQTLIALCASRAGKGGLLPSTYEVSLGKHASPQAIARHYVGAVRDRFYAEGLAKIAPVLLAKDVPEPGKKPLAPEKETVT